MTITDDARSDLYQRLKETMGDRPAGTLMAHLPPVGWVDVATKQDLVLLKQDIAHLEAVTDLKLQALEHKMQAGFSDVRTDFNRALRVTALTMVATNITLFGLAVATVRLA